LNKLVLGGTHSRKETKFFQRTQLTKMYRLGHEKKASGSIVREKRGTEKGGRRKIKTGSPRPSKQGGEKVEKKKKKGGLPSISGKILGGIAAT